VRVFLFLENIPEVSYGRSSRGRLAVSAAMYQGSLFPAEFDIYLSEPYLHHNSDPKFWMFDPITDRKTILHRVRTERSTSIRLEH
jgi:hypothetical protein